MMTLEGCERSTVHVADEDESALGQEPFGSDATDPARACTDDNALAR
jgi:hypothetical protein